VQPFGTEQGPAVLLEHLYTVFRDFNAIIIMEADNIRKLNKSEIKRFKSPNS
jgi:hypothetical protein